MQYLYLPNMCIPQILCFVSGVITIAWDIWFPCLLLTLHCRSTWNLVICYIYNQTYIYANELPPGHANYEIKAVVLKCLKNVIVCYIIYNIFWTIFVMFLFMFHSVRKRTSTYWMLQIMAHQDLLTGTLKPLRLN